jgi:hypothetical protein
VAWIHERTIPTERPQLVGQFSANFSGQRCHVVSVTDPKAVFSVSRPEGPQHLNQSKYGLIHKEWSYLCNRLLRPIELWDIQDRTFSRQEVFSPYRSANFKFPPLKLLAYNSGYTQYDLDLK